MEIVEVRKGIWVDRETEAEVEVVEVPAPPPPPFENVIAGMIYGASVYNRPGLLRCRDSGAFYREAVLVSRSRYEALIRAEDAVRDAKAAEAAANPDPFSQVVLDDLADRGELNSVEAVSARLEQMGLTVDPDSTAPTLLEVAIPTVAAGWVPPEPPDTTNDHLVGVQGDKVTMVLPPTEPMPVDEALRLAAWIVCVAEVHTPDADEKFAAVLAAVRST